MSKHPNDPDGPDEKPYDVGYGKPPKETQFKPGQSGNPSGRPKGPPSLRDSLNKALRKEITVQTSEGPQEMPMMEVVVTAMINSAAKGTIGGGKLVTALVERHEIGGDDRGVELTEADKWQFEELAAILKGLQK